MSVMILGMVLFLGVHSLRMVAPGWREAAVSRLGQGGWKGLYSLLSLAGLALMIWGYQLAKAQPVLLWAPPTAMKHIATLGVLVAFVLLLAPYVPRNHVRRWAGGHPMFLGTAIWAASHLAASAWLHAMTLFAAFALWSVGGFMIARRRAAPADSAAPSVLSTVALVIVAGLAWFAFARYAHVWLMGVSPFG
jgi:uncharacterized membrane protein